MTKLSVNVNKVALLRNSRGTDVPNLERHVRQVIAFGADGITIHPRADRRHITPEDAHMVARTVREQEINFEGDVREEFLDLVLQLRPTQCTLVPVSHGEVTSSRGWQTAKWAFLLEPVVRTLKQRGVRVALFIEPDPSEIPGVAAIGADRIEIYTAHYAHAFLAGHPEEALERVAATARAATAAGIGVNAGHDLTVENLTALLARVPQIAEVSIGHHLVSYALEVGFERSVRAFSAACGRGA